MGRRLKPSSVLAYPGAAGAACHILRTDLETEGALPVDYVERVNRALDHIVRILAQSLRLEEVSQAACFSPFHFHRVFKGLLGERVLPRYRGHIRKG